jgi:hypothetical protein
VILSELKAKTLDVIQCQHKQWLWSIPSRVEREELSIKRDVEMIPGLKERFQEAFGSHSSLQWTIARHGDHTPTASVISCQWRKRRRRGGGMDLDRIGAPAAIFSSKDGTLFRSSTVWLFLRIALLVLAPPLG